MNVAIIGTYNPIFRALQEINTRPKSYIKTEPTTKEHSEQLHTAEKDKTNTSAKRK
jgi:hypothetical protein